MVPPSFGARAQPQPVSCSLVVADNGSHPGPHTRREAFPRTGSQVVFPEAWLAGLPVYDPASLELVPQVLVLVSAFVGVQVGGTRLELVTSTMSTWRSSHLS